MNNNVLIDQTSQHFVIIREALPNEIKHIQELNVYMTDLSRQNFDQTYIEGWSSGEAGTAYFTSRLANQNKDGLFLVALDGDKFVGYMNGLEKKSESYRIPVKTAVLENIMILPEYQHKGIGKKMMEIFANWCRDRGIQKIVTSTLIRNTNAINFYHELGFVDYDVTLEVCLVPKAPQKQ